MKPDIIRVAIFFLGGSAVLCGCSVVQKIFVELNPFLVSGYYVPFLYGGVSGAAIGLYTERIRDLNLRLQKRVDTLESFLPICSNCKRIRKPDADPKRMESWEDVETYISDKTASQFSHGICPECARKL